MLCDFSYRHYKEILKTAQKLGFVITNFRDYPKVKNQPKIIILRHDIDALPGRALVLAKIEKSLGVRATYFVRVHGQYYFADEPKTRPILKAILRMGHEIGLHTEARSLAKVFAMAPADLFKSEKKYLEEILSFKIVFASEHGDLGRKNNFWQSDFLKQKSLGIKFYPQFFKDFEYFSDSLRYWKKGCLCQNLDKYDRIQVLTHGEWWGKNAKEEMIQKNSNYAKI